MALKEIWWHPDTCQCHLHIEFDDAVGWKNDGSDTILPDSTICASHAGKTRGNILAAVWLNDCARKNGVLGEALTRFAALRDDTNPNALHPSANFEWTYSGVGDARVLTITFTGRTISAANKTTLQNALNTRFGAGKVIVQ